MSPRHHGRSRLLDLARAPELRPRPFWRRRLLWLSLLTLMIATAWAVKTERLSKSGLTALLYELHDALWVPLYGAIWPRSQGFALIWILPLALLLLLAGVEYLGFGQPLRRGQIFAIRLILALPLSRAALTLQQWLGWRGFERLMAKVIETDLDQALASAKEAQLYGRRANTGRLKRLALQLSYLQAANPAVQLRDIESLALLAALDPTRHEAAAEALRRIWPAEAGKGLTLAQSPAADLPDLLRKLQSGTMGAEEAALATLAFARPEAQERADLIGAWFTEWARRRHMRAAGHEALLAAETLVDFSHWAAVAEGHSARYAPDWLGTLLGEKAMARDLGERRALGLKDEGHA